MPPEDITPYENIDTDGSLEPGRTGIERSDAARRPDSENESTSGTVDSSTADNTENTPTTPLGLRRSDRNRGGGSSLSGRSQPPLTTRQSPPRPSAGLQSDLDRLVRESLRSLETQRRDLQREVEQLERRKARIETEMKQSFAGSSQDIAIRVQGFKDYLVGSLQDLATAAEQVNLVPKPMVEPPPAAPQTPASTPSSNDDGDLVSMAGNRFAEQRDRIYSLLDQYRTRPDYYGPPWQLRRTFEPVHADRVSNWFFTQGSRGAVKSMGSRLQNVLVASAAISCLYAIYDRRLCVLVLATTPERLGEWRRWLQDCLGIARADFGTNRGVMLFESPEPMAQRAERLLDTGRLPFLIMDEAEDKVSLSLLQYPLWLGFAPDPANPSSDYDYY